MEQLLLLGDQISDYSRSMKFNYYRASVLEALREGKSP